MAMEPDEELHESLAKLFLLSDYFDLTVKCGSDVHKVHKAIVCPRAEFFAAAERFGGKEAASGEVTLKDDDPELIKCMFQYLYTLDYSSDSTNNEPNDTIIDFTTLEFNSSDDAGSSVGSSVEDLAVRDQYSPSTQVLDGLTPGLDGKLRDQKGNIIGEVVHGNPKQLYTNGHKFDEFGCCYSKRGGLIAYARVCHVFSNLVLHASMYSVADKFGIPGLKLLARKKFCAGCETSWDTAEFLMALDVVYTTTVNEDKGLRDIILKTISDHMELLKKPEMEAAMLEFNGLAFGLLKMKHP